METHYFRLFTTTQNWKNSWARYDEYRNQLARKLLNLKEHQLRTTSRVIYNRHIERGKGYEIYFGSQLLLLKLVRYQTTQKKKKKSTNSHNVTNLPTLSWSKKSRAPVYYRNENRNPRVKHRIPKCPKARKNVEKGLLNEGKPGWR